MKKNLILYLLSLLTNFAIAQNTILWSVNKPGSDKKSYILGTFHQIGNSFIDGKPTIEELLSKSDLAIFESVEDKNNNVVNVLLSRTDDFSYRELLHKEDVIFLESYSKDWKVPLSKLKPGELLAKLQQEIIKQKCETIKPTDTLDHIDDYLQVLAKKHNIRIKGLESYTDQLNAINTNTSNKEELTWDKAKGLIHQYIFDAESKDKTRQKQICALATEYMKMKLDYQLDVKCAENDEIISNRNKKWIPQIIQSLEENKSLFIIVGLYHLYGECGVISQLRKKGYEVNPVKLR